MEVPQLMLGGRSIRGVVQGDAVPREFIPRLVGLWRESRIPMDRLITVYPFERVAEAMADSHAGAAVKPVLRAA